MSNPADPAPTVHPTPHPRPRSARVRTDAQGRVVLCKEATGPAGTARLEREARLLGLARHPGVVTLVALEHDPAGARLTTTFVGSHTLATWTCPSPEHAAGIVAAVAETVADLHQLGIVHGRLTADHVLIDREGRPVLTGFAEAACGAAGPADPTDPTNPPDHADLDGPSRPADVQALGALLRRLVAPHPEPTSLVPERRWRRHRHDAVARRSLLTLADHAEADDPAARPGARRLAAAILTAVPAATLGPPADDDAPPAIDCGPRSPVDEGPGAADAAGPGSTDAADHGWTGSDPDPFPVEPGGLGVPADVAADVAANGLRFDTDRPADDRAASERTAGGSGPVRTWPPRPGRPAPSRRRGLPAAAALVGLALVGVGAANLAHGERPDLRDTPVDSVAGPQPAAAPGPAGGTVPTTTDPSTRPAAAPTTAVPVTPTPTEPVPTTAAPVVPTRDAADRVPCPAAIPAAPQPTDPPERCTERQPAGIVTHDGRRYAIGEPGDEVAIGPFGCPDPVAVAAVLRPATGEVFVFTAWADETSDRTAVAAAPVAPGSTWAPSTVRGGCAPLVVRRPDGTTETIPPPTRSAP